MKQLFCRDCDFYVPYCTSNKNSGICRRFPLTLVIEHNYRHKYANDKFIDSFYTSKFTYPTVSELSICCGEFKQTIPWYIRVDSCLERCIIKVFKFLEFKIFSS